jgi:hypothetical protein
MPIKECFHCHKEHNSYNKLCQDCRFNKDIMMTFTEIKKIYKLEENQIDKTKVYSETFRTKYGTEGTSYYLPDIKKFVDILAKNLSDNNPIKKAVVKLNNEQCAKQKKEERDKFLYNFIWNDVNKNLSKYNIPQDFLQFHNVKNIIISRIAYFLERYTQNNNNDSFVIDILEYLENIYNRKIEIDEKIENFVDERCKEHLKNYIAYKNYIFHNHYNIEFCMQQILQEQDRILYQKERQKKYEDFMKNFIAENSDFYLPKYDNLIEKEKICYIDDNKINYDTFIEKIQLKLFSEMKIVEFQKVSKKLNSITQNRISISKLEEIYQNKYKNKEFKNMKKFSEKLNKYSEKIEEKYKKILTKIQKILGDYEEIEEYLYDFKKNNFIFKSKDIFLDKGFIDEQNRNVNKEIENYFYGLKKSNEVCEQIKVFLNNIKEYIININQNDMKCRNIINYFKKLNGYFLTNDIQKFILLLDKTLSQEEMIKEIKQYYFLNCIFRKNNWNTSKNKFLATPIFQDYLKNNNKNFDYIQREFQIYVSKNKNKK